MAPFIALPVQERDIFQAGRIEHLSIRVANRRVVLIGARCRSAGHSSSIRNWLIVIPASGDQVEIR